MKAFLKEGLQKCPQLYHQVTHELRYVIVVNEIAPCKHIVEERGWPWTDSEKSQLWASRNLSLST